MKAIVRWNNYGRPLYLERKPLYFKHVLFIYLFNLFFSSKKLLRRLSTDILETFLYDVVSAPTEDAASGFSQSVRKINEEQNLNCTTFRDGALTVCTVIP